MKPSPLPIIVSFGILVLASACVSAPGATSGSVAPVAMEKSETIRVPVLVEEKDFLADGTLDRTTTWEYDSSYREALKRVVVEAGRPEPVETLTRAVSSGSIVETLVDAEGRLVSRKTTLLDTEGRKVRETVEGSIAERGTVSEWIYGSDGNLAEWRVADASGQPLAVTRYAYSRGRLTQARMYDPSGTLEGRLDYEYDSSGRLSSRTFSDAAGKLERREEFKWRDGVLVEESSYGRSGALERRATHEIGPDGELVATLVHDQAGRLRQKLVYSYFWREETRVATDPQ
ncbi:MAG: hypothetical protein JXA15_04485 [Spirochaetales bacterium]|nr:hypothetical protein [Spirochaetales bacterium]